MRRPAITTQSTAFLLRRIELGETGRARVVLGELPIDVYLLGGQIMAAEEPDDVRQLVRLCHLRGALTDAQAAALIETADGRPPALGRLLDVAAPELMDQLLFERFRQNLATWCGSDVEPTWEPLKAVFVDNLQMVADAQSAIEDCCNLWDEAAATDPTLRVVRGHGRVDNKEQRLVAAKLGHEPQVLAHLVEQLPMEPLVACVVIRQMLANGSVVVADGSAPAEPEEDIDDEPTVQAPDAARAPEFALHAPTPEPVLRNVGLASLSAWLDTATSVDDDELEFFSDHDYERGSADDGAFSTEQHNLDRVEVITPGPVDVTETEDAAPVRFSAPVLSPDEAIGKIAVTNDVLAAVVRAFDATEGTGRGNAVVQLLVDGSPSRYAALLQDVQVDAEGRIPEAAVLANLQERPPSEHRQLINETLVDIIERALSSAADELPDETFDLVLEKVAGYRQRLGL